VLVIDDEPLVTRAVRRALHLEHEVVEMHRAEDALQKISSGERFDVIISELMLPGMSGMALHAALEQRAPEQARKMVFFASSPASGQARDFLLRVTNRRVQKPFDVRYLQAVVNERVRD
jgi:CheY-like chemotaxis protein